MRHADPARTYLEDLHAAFTRAATQARVTTIDITPGGVPIRLEVIGDTFVDHITRAIGSASGQGSTPRATIRVFDGAACDGAAPPPRWPLDAYLARDEIAGSGADGVDASCDVVRRVICLYDHTTANGVWFAADQDHLAPWDPAAPLRNVMHWVLRDHGLQLAHGAVVGRSGTGVLLTAKGGSGKSTTALGLVHAGWDYVSDDYCLLATASPPRAHRLYRVAKADDAALARFPGLVGAVTNPRRGRDEKAVIDVSAVFGSQVVDDMALTAVVIPRIDPTARAPRLLPRSAADVARALVPSTMLQLPACTADTPARLGAAVAGLEYRELVLPVDTTGVSDVLAGLLETSRAPVTTGEPG